MVMGVSWRDVTTAAHPVPMKDQTYVLMAYACMKVSVATALVSIGVCVCVCVIGLSMLSLCVSMCVFINLSMLSVCVCVHRFVHVITVFVCVCVCPYHHCVCACFHRFVHDVSVCVCPLVCPCHHCVSLSVSLWVWMLVCVEDGVERWCVWKMVQKSRCFLSSDPVHVWLLSSFCTIMPCYGLHVNSLW